MPIRKRGDRWQVRVALGGGRRIERTLPPGAKRADALALEARLVRQRVSIATGQADHSIDGAIDRWLTDAQALKSWQRDLRYRIPILRQYTAGRQLRELPAVADKIKANGRKAGLTAAAINRYVALLRRVGNLAERWGWTDEPLGRRVVLLPESSQRHVYLTPEQVAALAEAAGPSIGDLIWMAALTGLRRSELLALKPDQVRDGVLVLDANTKSGRPRGIPLPPEAARIAQDRLPWRLTYSQLRDAFNAARDRVGLHGVRFHDLRHTYGSWLAQAGQPMTAIRDLMGHSSLAVTSRYSHLSPAHLVAAVAALPERVRHGSEPAAARPKKKRANR